MSRIVKVAAAQLGPISLEESRSSAINRMISLMREAKKEDANLIVYPELAREAGIEGKVYIKAFINVKGIVTSV